MNTPSINTTKSVVPMIYAYTTPGVTYHEGWIKIGYTEQEVEHRLKQQTHTADIEYHEEWRGMAVFEDGSAQRFSDKQFHSYLRKMASSNNSVRIMNGSKLMETVLENFFMNSNLTTEY